MDKLLSVIVAVYNAEKHLNECVDSIISATNQVCEIILVDDGSGDGSGAICDEYALKNPYIRVVHQENKGVVRARQEGFRASCGKYVTFVDSDDWIDSEMYSDMLDVGIQSDSDVVICDITRETSGGSVILHDRVKAGLYEDQSALQSFYSVMLFDAETCWPGVNPSMCNKIFKREIVEKIIYDIDESISYGEDGLCSYQALLDADRIFVIKNVGYYHYRDNEASLTNAYNPELLEKFMELCDMYRANFAKRRFGGENQIDGYMARFSLECIRGELLLNTGCSVWKRLRTVNQYVKRYNLIPVYRDISKLTNDKRTATKMKLIVRRQYLILYLMLRLRQGISRR